MTSAVPRAKTPQEERGEVVIKLLSWCEESDGYCTTTYEIPGSRAAERFFCEVKNPRGKIIHTTLVYGDIYSAVDVAAMAANVARRAHRVKVTLWGRLRARALSLLASRAIP